MTKYINFNTAVVFTKGFCVLFGTAFITLQTALSQWSNVPDEPSRTQWIMMLGGAIGAGLIALGGWLSQAFGNYINEQKSNTDQTKTVEAGIK
jgi:hypothetical protein